MSRTSFGRTVPAKTSSMSTLTAALFTVAAMMAVSGAATAVATVPPVVTATYYVSAFLSIGLLWAHSIQTVLAQ